MNIPQFWTDRLERHGHTGWSNPAIYAYDQYLRLAAIEQMVRLLPTSARRAALDFGCGVGDFCKLLSRYYSRVIGFDISARILAAAQRRNPSSAINYTDHLDQALAMPCDLILSVTVLQHVVDDGEVARLLPRWAAALQPSGRVVVMETLAEQSQDAGYLKRRTLDDVVEMFRAAGLGLLDQRTFYHPTEAPTRAFLQYRASLVNKLLARGVLSGMTLLSRPLVDRAERAAARDTEYFNALPSPTRILTFARE